MDFTEEQRKKLDEFAQGKECPYKFKCYSFKYKDIIRKCTVGLEEYLECIDCSGEAPGKCPFSLTFFGNTYLCTCPIRDYIVKNTEG